MKKTNPLFKTSLTAKLEELCHDSNIQNFIRKNTNYTAETHRFFCESQNLTQRLKTEEIEDEKPLNSNEDFFKSPRNISNSLGNMKKKFLELNHAINLENKNISEFPMQYYSYMPQNVRIIDLRNNKLKKFPEEIINFKNLDTLKLDNNSIHSIPSTIFSSFSPKFFSISNNYLKGIPIEISLWQKNLEYLNISVNFIAHLPKEIGLLSNLKSLHINNNSFVYIPNDLRKLSNLKEIGLDWFKYIVNGVQNTINSTINKKIFTFFFMFLQETKYEENFSLKEFFGNFSKKLSFSQKILSHPPEKLIFEATINEDLGILRYLINEFPSELTLNAIDSNGHSPLSLSISEEKYLSAKLLIQNGCDVNIGGGEYGSSLNISIYKQQIYLLKDLVKYGADSNISNKKGEYSLNFLIKEWEDENEISRKMFEVLMENQTFKNKRNNEGFCPLHIIIANKLKIALKTITSFNESFCEENQINLKDLKDLKDLRDMKDLNNFSKNCFDFSKKTRRKKLSCLHLAAETDDYEIITEVLNQKNCEEQLFERDIDGNRPIHLAKKNYTTIKILRKFEKNYIMNFLPMSNKKKLEISSSNNNNEEDFNIEDDADTMSNVNSKMNHINVLNIKNNNFKSIITSSLTLKNGIINTIARNDKFDKSDKNSSFVSSKNKDKISLNLNLKNLDKKMISAKKIKRANIENNNDDSSVDSLKAELDEENNCFSFDLRENSYRKIDVKHLPISPNNIKKIERFQKYSNYFKSSQNEMLKFAFNSSRKLDLDEKKYEKPVKNVKKTNEKAFLLSNVYKNLVQKIEKYKKKIEEFHEEIVGNKGLLSTRLFYLFSLMKIQHKILKIAMDLIDKKISLTIINSNLFESSQINEEEIKANSKNSNLQDFQIVFFELGKILQELEKNKEENYDNFFIKYEILCFFSFFNVCFFRDLFKNDASEIMKFELCLSLLQFKQVAKLYR